MRTEVVLALLSALCLCACVDPLVNGDYRGEPLAHVEGQIFLSAEQYDEPWIASANLRVALFWSGGVSEGSLYDSDDGQIVEQQAVTRGVFPARYAMTLYQPPSERALRPVEGGEGRLGVAQVLLYWDNNNNGVWDRTRENLAGGTAEFALVYTPEGASGGPLDGDLVPGYHLVRLDDRCSDINQLFLRRAATSSKVNLTVVEDVGELLPDADCDGLSDTCEDLFEALESSIDTEERIAILEIYGECLYDLWVEVPLLSEEECAEFVNRVSEEGGDIPNGLEPVFEDCTDLLSGESPDEDELFFVCDGLFEASLDCEEQGDGDCSERFAIALDICFRGLDEGGEICESFYQRFDAFEDEEAIDPAFWLEFSECLLSNEDELEPSEVECFDEGLDICFDLLDEFENDDEGLTDQEWDTYNNCLEEHRLECSPEDACGVLLEEEELEEYLACLCAEQAIRLPDACERLLECEEACEEDACFEFVDEYIFVCEDES